MKTNLLFLLSALLIPFLGVSQYSIDDHYIEFTDVSSVEDFYSYWRVAQQC